MLFLNRFGDNSWNLPGFFILIFAKTVLYSKIAAVAEPTLLTSCFSCVCRGGKNCFQGGYCL